MMNLLALALLLSSLAAAGVFYPTTGSINTNPNPPLVREGHRLIVLEYERQVPAGSSAPKSGDLAGEAKDKLLPDLGQKSNLFSKTKKKASELEEYTADGLKSAAETTTGKANRLQESATDALKSTAESTKEKADRLQKSAADALKVAAKTVKGKAERFQESFSDAIVNATDSAKEKAAGLMESVAGAVKSAVVEDVAANISAAAKKAADRAEEAAHDLVDILQRVKELARDAAAYVVAGAGRAARSVVAAAYLLGFATAYGTCVWVTFASGHVLASALPRQQFGIVQSRIYPVYFKVIAFSVAAALSGHFLAGGRRSPAERAQGFNLLAALGMVVVNMLYLEPRATKVMFERMKIEKEEGRGRDITDGSSEETTPGLLATGNEPETEASKSKMMMVSKRLKRLNSSSSFLNVLALMGLSWHLMHLSHLLDSSCSAS